MRRALLALVMVVAGCGDGPLEEFTLPEGFPELRVPASNPITPEKRELGRYLFYETRLSGNGTQSCGSCHEQALAFTDGKTVGIGSTGEAHPRNAQGLANVGYASSLTWANPVLEDLETQILLPLFGDAPVEMAATDASLDLLASDPLYTDLFERAYPEEAEPIHWDNVIGALATFSRTLVSGNSPFDQFAYQGNSEALSDSARRGLDLFFTERLECHHCHGGFNFAEATTTAHTTVDARFFHNTGLYNIDGDGAYPNNNTGVYEITGDPNDMGRFRPPSLRNVAVTAPYMHDGSRETLEDVLADYARGGRLTETGPYAGDGAESPLKSGLVPGFSLTEQETADVIAFLESLTDEQFLTDPALSDPFAE